MKLTELKQQTPLEEMTTEEIYAAMSETMTNMNKIMDIVDQKIEKNETTDRR
jgi:hypothetical protein